MRKLNVYVVASAILLTILAGVAVASHHGETKKQKKAILLFAFGSSEESAQISFENIDKSVKTAYLNVSVKWAYTSHIIRKKLVSQGKLLDSPEIALGKMVDEGFTHVAVQSLHTIAGVEYHDLPKVVGSFKVMRGLESVFLGHPLLTPQNDMTRTVHQYLEPFQKSARKAKQWY